MTTSPPGAICTTSSARPGRPTWPGCGAPRRSPSPAARPSPTTRATPTSTGTAPTATTGAPAGRAGLLDRGHAEHGEGSLPGPRSAGLLRLERALRLAGEHLAPVAL